MLTRLATGELTPAEIDDADRPNTSMARMADNMAIRTKFFDEFFLDATGAASDRLSSWLRGSIRAPTGWTGPRGLSSTRSTSRR